MTKTTFGPSSDLQPVIHRVNEFLAKNGAVDVGAEAPTKKTVYRINDGLYCVETSYTVPPYTAHIRPVDALNLITTAELAQMAAKNPILIGRTGDARGW